MHFTCLGGVSSSSLSSNLEADSTSGLGNLKENAIPQCQMIRLQRLVDALYDADERPVPFWLDTLCVPLRRRFRRTSIVSMASIYRNADKVLVLDSSLLHLSTSTASPIDLHLQLMGSGWAKRLWTFHETALAQSLFYQFSDRSVTRRDLLTMLLDSIPRYDEQHPCFEGTGPMKLGTSYGSEGRKKGIRILYSEPIARQALYWLKSLESFRETSWTEHGDRLRAISNPLRWRSTSRPQDEAICLAGLLDLTYAQRAFLFSIDHSQRMKQLILSLESVPVDILFVNAPRESDSGFSWIPASFLGGNFDASMAGRALGNIQSDASLQVSLPGILIKGSLESIFEDKRVYIQHPSGLYYMVPRNPDGFDWPIPSFPEFCVLLRSLLVYPGSAFGALVAITTREARQMRCQYVTPIMINGHAEQNSLCEEHEAPIVLCEDTNEDQIWRID